MRLRKSSPINTSIFLILMLALVACGGQETPAPTQEPTEITAEKEPEPDTPEAPPDEPTAAITNAIDIADQGLGSDSTITSARVVSTTPGWLVIHDQVDGAPGPILGFAPISAGENRDVTVPIDAAQASETAYAMLHVDAGTLAEFEFSGDDIPATDADGDIVMAPFAIDLRGVNAVSVADQPLGDGDTFTVAAVRAASTGWIVIYAQDDDEPGPILGFAPVNEGQNREVVVRIDIDDLSDVLYAMLHLDVGNEQLFDFPSIDVPVTDAKGNHVAASFNVLPSTVKIGYDSELGAFLVAAGGLTLYRFATDEESESRCYDECLQSWQPLVLKEGEILSTGPGIYGDLDLFERTDGLYQVTYNDSPLYTFNGDQNPGDTNGQGLEGAWFVVSP